MKTSRDRGSKTALTLLFAGVVFLILLAVALVIGGLILLLEKTGAITELYEKVFDNTTLLAVFLALVTHDITDIGQSDQHTGSVLVAQSALHAVALEKSAVDTARKLDLVGQFVDKILLVHRFIYY